MKNQNSFFSFFYRKKLQGVSQKRYTKPIQTFALKCFFLFLFIIPMLSVKDASATHFRYGNITWKRVLGFTNRIEFKVSQAWRRDYPWPGNPPTPVVGSIISTGAMTFGAGQGSTNVNLTVTSINIAENWLYGEATIVKDYPAGVATYLVEFSGCCRISTLAGGNNDVNYINRTFVTTGNGNDAPVSTMPPYINRPNNAITTFQVPATDPNGHALTYSLATLAETGLASLTPGLTVSPSGLVTFNPAGKALNSLWACAIKIQDALGAYIVVDFMVKVVGPSLPPVFTYPPTPNNNFTYILQPGQNLNFTVRATDPDVGDMVSLSGVGIPVGATFNPASGNPVLSAFNWTPAANQLGTYVINFIAQDQVGVQTNTVVNVVVSLKPQFVIPPTPGNNSTICIQPGETRTDTFRASDPDPLDAVSLNATGTLPTMTFTPALPTTAANPKTTVLNFTPTPANWGLRHLTMTATDTYGETESINTYYIVNNAPTFTSVPVTTAIANVPYTYLITTDDLNIPFGDEVGIESIIKPAFLSIIDNNNGTFTLSGTPGIGDIGSYNILIEIEDELNHINGTHCGNNVQNFVLNVQGTIPVITCPGNISDIADAGVCTKANVMYTATATGIPAPVITYSVAPGSTFNVGTAAVTAYADNGVGIDSCTFTVTISDNLAPVPDVASLPNVTGECSASVTAPTATDNCAGAITGTTNDPISYNTQGTYVITWSYDDGNGNVSTQNQTVVVDDNTAPVADMASLPNVTGECSASVTAPTATDNCAGAITGTTNNPTSYNAQGTYVITWSYDDGNGNVSTQNQTVVIDDNTAPVPNVATLPNVTGECSASVTAPTATDNCAGAITGTTNDPTSYNTQGTYVITWTYNDGNGNVSTQSQTVVIDDNTAPVPNVATLPNVTGECSASVTAPTATDNCAGAITGTTNDPTSYNTQGTYVITWTYNDGNGNVSTQSQTVVIDDNTAPVPNVATLQNVMGECSASVTAPTATDNCAGAITGTTNNPTSYNTQGTYVITWTYNDGNGNVSTQNQTVIVDDNTPPVANCHSAIVTLNAAGQASVTAAMINNNSTDNCGIQSMTVAPSNFTCADIGNKTVTLTVTDIGGNVSNCTTTVTVKAGNTINISGCPTNINLNCIGGSGVAATWTPPTGTLSGPCINPCTGGLPKAGFTYMGTHNGHSYYRSNSDDYTWVQAKNAAIAAGGNLVSINNAAENAYVSSLIPANCNSGEIWIGYNDVAVENNFVWANGDPSGYTSWAPGEPNNNPSGCNCNNNQADYVSMRKNNSKWYDRNICEKNSFILEVACVNPVQIVQVAGPAPGAVFAGGTTTPVSYLAYTTAGDSAYCNFTVTVAECVPNYCQAPGYSTQYEYINRVQLNTINNLSGNNGGYGNFAGQNTTLTKGTVVPVTLTPGFNNCNYTEYWRVWIDWNRDGDWNDANEMAASGYGTGAITKNIAVPNGAQLNKSLKMRVIMRYGGYAASPCDAGGNGCGGNTEWGEVEDYTIFVQNGLNKTDEDTDTDPVVENAIEPSLQNGIELTSVYPNPVYENQREINIQYRVLHAGKVNVLIQSIDGKILSNQEVTASAGENRNAISLPGLSAGIYTVVVSSTDGKHLQKFIVK